MVYRETNVKSTQNITMNDGKMQVKNEIIEEFKKLYTGAVSDVMLAMGQRATIDPRIRPIYEGIMMCGRAFTIKATPSRKNDQTVDTDAKEACKPGDVVIIDGGGTMEQTFWGENSATACKVRGAVGTVIDGACRDIASIRKMKFPTYCRFISPGISKGIVSLTKFNVTVSCGDVSVNPGDIVLGDDDGVVIVPQEMAESVLEKTNAYGEVDRRVAQALLEGKSVREAYALRKDLLKRITNH